MKKNLKTKNVSKDNSEKAKYYLIIHTNSYTGNFERELVGFSVGRLIGCNNHSFRKYISAFWNCECGSDIDSLEDFKRVEEEISDKLKKESEETLFKNLIEKKHLTFDEAKLKVKNFREKSEEKDFRESLERIYDTYLSYTNQRVDDFEEKTFYNISSYSKEENGKCDSIYIQLKDFLPDNFEEIIIRRIKSFFELDIYNVFENYEYLCQFESFHKPIDKLELLDLELVDSDGTLIKKYV